MYCTFFLILICACRTRTLKQKSFFFCTTLVFYNIPRAQKYRDKRQKNAKTKPKKMNRQNKQKQVEQRDDLNNNDRIAKNEKQKDKRMKRIDRTCIKSQSSNIR